MSVLIIKLGATGDVVRTTQLFRRLDGPVSWITAENNLALLEGKAGRVGSRTRNGFYYPARKFFTVFHSLDLSNYTYP